MNTPLIWSILSILVGIYISALGLRHIYRIYIEMTWLHVQTTNDPGGKINYSFTSNFMRICSWFPVIGLTLILIGIKYLPV